MGEREGSEGVLDLPWTHKENTRRVNWVVEEVKKREHVRMGEDLTWGEVFSEENKQRVLEELKKRHHEEEWPNKERSRDAAVLVPMVTVEGEPSILFTVRSQHVSRHRQLVRSVNLSTSPTVSCPFSTNQTTPSCHTPSESF